MSLVVAAFLASGVVAQEAGRLVGELRAKAAVVYSTGSYLEIRQFARFELEYAFRPLPLLALLGIILAYFLAGTAVGTSGLLRDPERHLVRLRKLLPWLLGVGLLGNLVMLVSLRNAGSGGLTPRVVLGSLALLVGGPCLTASYVCGTVLLFHHPWWRRVLQPLAVVGRMALTKAARRHRTTPAAGPSDVPLAYLQVIFTGWHEPEQQSAPAVHGSPPR